MCCGCVLCFQFPAVNHPQTLERRYLGIIGGGLLDLLKVEMLLCLTRVSSYLLPHAEKTLLIDLKNKTKNKINQNCNILQPSFANCVVSAASTS